MNSSRICISHFGRAGFGAGTNNAAIRRLQGLTPLSSADIAALEQITLRRRTVEAHADLIQEGEETETVFVMLEGFAGHYKQRQAGARQNVAFLLPGDFCNVGLSDLGPFNHAVGTFSSCVVARASRQAVTELTDRHPSIARALHLAKHIEVATSREWLVNLACRSAMERMAHLFCELLVRFEAVGLAQASTCPFPLTQVGLAQTLGLSTVHVNRTLQDLRRERLVELRGRSLKILDLSRLQSIAEFDRRYLEPPLIPREQIIV